jgi:hypothetical protein
MGILSCLSLNKSQIKSTTALQHVALHMNHA